MNIFDLLWIEDDAKLVNLTLDNFKEDEEELGFSIIPWHYISMAKFRADASLELSSLLMELVCVDYNLPGGVNGDEVISFIRSFAANKNINIIFYSAAKNEEELRAILSEKLTNMEKIYFAQKDTLSDRIQNLLSR